MANKKAKKASSQITSQTIFIVVVATAFVFGLVGILYSRSQAEMNLAEIDQSFGVPLSSQKKELKAVAKVTNEAIKKNNTVRITSKGLIPQRLAVKSGTTVAFLNEDLLAHQPASDVHPTHLVLPGFDARRGLGKGESYSFIFVKKGTFSYHDHLNPASQIYKGSIVVE